VVLLLTSSGGIHTEEVAMSFPLTHLYAALLAAAKYPDGVLGSSLPALIRGSLVPGAACLSGAGWQATHGMVSSMREVLRAKSAFLAGVALHGYVDNIRLAFLNEHHPGLVKKYTDWPFAPAALQALEDQFAHQGKHVLPRHIDQALQTLADGIVPGEEDKLGIEARHITRWYGVLHEYLQGPLDDAKRLGVAKSIGMPEDQATEVNRLVAEFAADDRVMIAVREFFEALPNLLSE
jgi:hypothetical protein